MQHPTSEQLQAELAELESRLGNPTLHTNPSEAKKIAREHRDKEHLLALIQEYENSGRELQDLMALISSKDADLKALAEQDQARLHARQAELVSQIESALIPRDPRDSRDAILEIRSASGGEEAALFAQELFRAYTRYAEKVGWNVHIVSRSDSQETGGFKEVMAEINGNKAFGTLKFERGVHRVQRIPKTEKMGRIHTSTVTVAVLPQVEEAEIEIRPEDLKTDTYRASGAGGQHVNKTSSAVRITHIPTGTVVAVQDERSQHKNRDKAMKILRARLSEAQDEARLKKESAERKSQVGTGARVEKIRTYNFPQDRVTDHRFKQSWGAIANIMEGDMGPIFTALREADLAEKMGK